MKRRKHPEAHDSERGSHHRNPCGRSCKQRTSQKDRHSCRQDKPPGKDERIRGLLIDGKRFPRTGGWEGSSRVHGSRRFRFTRKDSSQHLIHSVTVTHTANYILERSKPGNFDEWCALLPCFKILAEKKSRRQL